MRKSGVITYSEEKEARSRDIIALQKAKQREKETEHLYKWEHVDNRVFRRRISDGKETTND